VHQSIARMRCASEDIARLLERALTATTIYEALYQAAHESG
jgi:hypothetical protein